MKKALIALAVLGTVSGAAMAQSSVTLYGVADIAVGKAASYGQKQFGAASNSIVTNGTSRIGLTGKEDLGGGLWAGFKFEGPVNLANGTSAGANATQGATWSREANVMLGGNQWGTVKLGRSVTPSYNGVGAWELTGLANYSVVTATYGYGAAPNPRNNSQIDYKTPNFGGVSAEVSYVTRNANGLPTIAGSQTSTDGSPKADRWDLNVIYANGPISGAFTVNKSNKVNAYNSDGTVSTDGTNRVNKANYTLGGQYKFGTQFALAASYNRANSAQAWRGPLVDSLQGSYLAGRRDGFSLGGSYFAGPFTVTLDLTRDIKNQIYGINKKYTNGLLEGKYSLSKRTFLYADYLRLDGQNNYGLGVRHNF